MKKKYLEEIAIPSGVSCELANKILKCKKDSKELSREMKMPHISVKIENNKIILSCESGNKKEYKVIKANIAHLKKMFMGLEKDYVYHLESCNVHFPMTMKVDGSKLVINNFLGEKTPRFARILPGVKVDVKGAKITVSSHDKDAAGHTASNLEKATKIKLRDRRIFQDGIFLTDRPGGAK